MWRAKTRPRVHHQRNRKTMTPQTKDLHGFFITPKDLMRQTLKPSETTLEELKQRSSDYGFWFLNTIVGTLSFLVLLAGAFSFVSGVITKHSTTMLAGCVLGACGLVLIVLLSIAQMLKDIRLNTRESLAIQRARLRSETDLEGNKTSNMDSDEELPE